MALCGRYSEVSSHPETQVPIALRKAQGAPPLPVYCFFTAPLFTKTATKNGDTLYGYLRKINCIPASYDGIIHINIGSGFSACHQNATIAAACLRDAALHRLVRQADYLLPDGVGVVMASKRTKSPLRARLSGIDTAECVLAIAAKGGLPVFLLGGKPGVAQLAAQRLQERFPELPIAGTHHGYFDKHGNENEQVLQAIATANSAIVFVCFGFPLQERWIVDNRDRLPTVRLLMGLGGSLDVWSGNIRRAPSWVQSIGLEWLWRAFREPKRAKRLLSLPKGLVSAITTKECR